MDALFESACRAVWRAARTARSAAGSINLGNMPSATSAELRILAGAIVAVARIALLLSDLAFIRQGESAATDSRKAPKQFRPFPKSSSSGNQELYGQ